MTVQHSMLAGMLAKTACSAVLMALLGAVPAGAAPQRGGRAATLYLSGAGEGGGAVAGVLRQALAKRAGLDFHPLEELLDPSARKVSQLEAIFPQIATARRHLTNLEVDKGLKLSADVVQQMERYFDVVGATASIRQRYVEVLGVLAKAYFYAGKEQEARETLAWALKLDPELDYDSKRYPPKMKGLFDTVQFLAHELGKKELIIEAEPQGSEIWIDGRPKGTTRLKLRLARGKHLVSVLNAGHAAKTVAVELGSDEEAQRVAVKLSQLPGAPLDALEAALGEARSGREKVAQARAMALLKVKLLVLGQLVATKGGSFIELYAAGEARGVGRARGRLDSPGDAESVLAALFAVPGPAPKQNAGPGLWSRMSRSKYFWPVVIGVVSVAAIGVTVAVAASSDDSDRRRLVPILPLLGF